VPTTTGSVVSLLTLTDHANGLYAPPSAGRCMWPEADCPVWMVPALQGICEGLACLVGVQSCVRPVCAVMTAGPDGFRGRGPFCFAGSDALDSTAACLVPGPTGSPSLHMALATSSRETAARPPELRTALHPTSYRVTVTPAPQRKGRLSRLVDAFVLRFARGSMPMSA
jgi:hypothetical protein